MNLDLSSEDILLEPERYELLADSSDSFIPTRRDLFRAVGGGLIVLSLMREAEAVQDPPAKKRRGGGQGGPAPREIGAWLHIGEDGAVTVYCGKAEVGQNIRTSLTQAVADELHADPSSIKLVMGDTALTPFDAGTFGSRTTPSMAPQLRRAAAAARELLISMAAEKWGVDRKDLAVAAGKVTQAATGRSLEFGKLTQGQKLLKAIDDNATIAPATRWEVAGHTLAKVDGQAIVTGQHRYASDIKRPGMLHGKVLRPPVYGATLVSVDTSRAAAMPGVIVVRDGDFVGALAPDSHVAARALAAIKAEWSTGTNVSDRTLFDDLKAQPAQPRAAGGRPNRAAGSPKATSPGSSDERREATYTIAYIAHAPLEPRAAVADWEDDKLTVWTGTQRPFGVRSEVARAVGVAEDRVRVIVPDTGAGYGGKHTGEAAVEAARLAKAAGRPVKMVWTREEEFTWAYFRPAGVIEAAGSVNKDGMLTSWEFHNYNSGGSGLNTPYDVPSSQQEFHQATSPLRQGSYRALASTANHFARESMMDELALAAGIDPLAFRLKNLKNPRVRAVLEAAANLFGWGGAKPAPDRGFGLACGTEKGGNVASCAEVAVDQSSGAVKVVRVVTAFECGAIVNPDHLKNQVEGATIMGLGGALFEAVKFDGGKILNPRFSRYRVPRFSDMPALEVVLLDRKDLPSAGAGEAPIVTVAPAVGNALFDAAGVRFRSLPMVPNGVVAKQEHQ
jgi:CO/xanthine dehydrogenase Mo-binding subunit